MSNPRHYKAGEIPCSGLGTGWGQIPLLFMGSLPTNYVRNITMVLGRGNVYPPLCNDQTVTLLGKVEGHRPDQISKISKVRQALPLMPVMKRNSCVRNS